MKYIVCRILSVDLAYGLVKFKVLCDTRGIEYWDNPAGKPKRDEWKKFNSKEEAEARAANEGSCFVEGVRA